MQSNEMIYLDHAATTPLRPEVLDEMLPYLTEQYGNPSTLYGVGKQAKQAIEQARETIATLLNVSPNDIFFTSGATEANNWAIKSIALQQHGTHIITTQIEHASVLETCQWLETQGVEVTYLPVDAEGFVSPESLKKAIRPETSLISIMHGNNEIGTIQAISELGKIARDVGVLFHTDAVQTVGKLDLDVQHLNSDLLSATAHKFYGPKGVGFLIANTTAKKYLQPLLHGGGQERGLRSTTENVAGIVGMAKALELAMAELSTVVPRERQLQETLIQAIFEIAPNAILNGPRDLSCRVPGNVHFSFPPIEGETLVLRLDLKNIAVSSGSACHSEELLGSHVVLALGKSEEVAKSTLRVSLGRRTTQAELDMFVTALRDVLERAKYFEATQAISSQRTREAMGV